MDDSRDLAKKKGGGLELFKLEQLLSDMENEPDWRRQADKCADYYDHKQASADQVQRSMDTGEPLSITNLIQRTINGALGQEAKTRLEPRVEADSAAFNDVAAALNERMHEAQRECAFDVAVSEAYKSQLITGIGWIEVSRNPDPLAYPYRVTPVHRNEVFWDWRAKAPDKSDAKWVVRQRWVDLDEAVVAMPQHRELLELGTHSGPISDSMSRAILATEGQFEDIHQTRRSFSRAQEEWLDNTNRKRVRFYSVYYKQPKVEVALAYGTRRVRFNERNPLHVMLMQTGEAKLIKGPSYEIRHAMFAGPYRLLDERLPGRRFPLVPFICYSCDDDYSPYGLVHGMIGPQDEFNERRSRLLWLLKAKQVFVDNDALDEKFNNFAQLATEVMRPDAMFVMNALRRNANGLVVNSNLGLQKEQADVMMDAKQLIQDVPGVYNALLGNNKDGVKSGVALSGLVEQSMVSLGETSDNYRTSRTATAELLQNLIAEDMSDRDLRLEIGSGSKRRPVVLNTFDERGIPVNHVEDAATRVALADIPSTPAYKSQQQINLANMAGQVGNDPIARPVLVAAMLEHSEIENGPMYARWIRQQAGIPEPDDLDDESMAKAQQAKQQQGQQQQQIQQAAMQIEIQKQQAEAAEKAAAAQERASSVELNKAKVAEIVAGILMEREAQQMAQQQALAAGMAGNASGGADALIQEALRAALQAQQPDQAPQQPMQQMPPQAPQQAMQQPA